MLNHIMEEKAIYFQCNGQNDYYSLTQILSECNALYQNAD